MLSAWSRSIPTTLTSKHTRSARKKLPKLISKKLTTSIKACKMTSKSSDKKLTSKSLKCVTPSRERPKTSNPPYASNSNKRLQISRQTSERRRRPARKTSNMMTY